jgi:hypothetical protein
MGRSRRCSEYFEPSNAQLDGILPGVDPHSTRPQAATERSPSDSRPQFSHDSDRLALRRASSAADLADASSAGTRSPVPKYISSGVCPRKAECGTCVLYNSATQCP